LGCSQMRAAFSLRGISMLRDIRGNLDGLECKLFKKTTVVAMRFHFVRSMPNVDDKPLLIRSTGRNPLYWAVPCYDVRTFCSIVIMHSFDMLHT
jgi:hypothetical protein